MDSVKFNIEHGGVVGPTIVAKSVSIPNARKSQKPNNEKIDNPKPMIKTITNPRYIGPGEWCALHRLAASANTDIGKKLFVNYMNVLSKTFPCISCREHIIEYMGKNPISKYGKIRNDEGIDVGYFKWTFKFHNAVNVRIHRAEFSWDEAYSLYFTDIGTCSSDCTGEGEEDSVSTPHALGNEKNEEIHSTVLRKKFQSVNVGKNNKVHKLYYDIGPSS